MRLAWLIGGRELDGSCGREDAAAGICRDREARRGIEPINAAVLTEENARFSGIGVLVSCLCSGLAKQAELRIAIKLRLRGVNLDSVVAAFTVQLNVARQNQVAEIGIVTGPDRASASLTGVELNALRGCNDAGALVERDSAGFHSDRLILAWLGWFCIGLRRGGRGALHFNRNETGSGSDAGVLVVFEFRTLDAIDAGTVFAIELDDDVVQSGVAVAKLRDTRRVNLKDGVAAVSLRIRYAVGLLLNVDSESLGNIAAYKAALKPGDAEKDRNCNYQQRCRDEHQRTDSLDGETHRSIPHAQACSQTLGKTFAEFAP